MRLREAREEMQYLLRVVDNGNMLTECSSLRTVFDIESIEDSPSVGDKKLGFGCVRIDGNAAKIYERASVGGALVVHPDHASFVFTVTRDMVDDILFACNDITKLNQRVSARANYHGRHRLHHIIGDFPYLARTLGTKLQRKNNFVSC